MFQCQNCDKKFTQQTQLNDHKSEHSPPSNTARQVWLTLCNACWAIFHAFIVVCWLFSKLTFSKNSFRNTIIVSHGLDPDQDRCSVGPDLDPNCLQRLSADEKSHH